MKKTKKFLALLLALLMAFSLVGCGGSGAGGAGGSSGDDVDYENMSMDELYELAKAEGGQVEVYSTTTDAQVACKKFAKMYPDIAIEYISCDNNTVASKIEMECDTSNINADVVQIKDNSGEVYHELVLYDYLDIYYPAAACAHIDEELLAYGLPLYATFNPWYYNTEMFPDGCPIDSWWDIVEGYDEATGKFTDQKWTIYTKDITGPSYASLWAQMIADSDAIAAQYKAEYGKDVVYTYMDQLTNTPGVMELPENNAAVEMFYRFSQMKMTELDDGDGVVDAVDQSINGPTLGLTSASKLDNAEQGMNIAWVTGLQPYTAFKACSYSYVVEGCDNPAAARLYINFCMGGDDGQSGCYTAFDKVGSWSVRDDVSYTKAARTAEEVILTSPDFEEIYNNYPNVKAYWTYWRSLAE
ncbi:MAG: extracellular solute-binding protein [Oscillospiraceae bacterium]|nr:extracellular solute-binding protein [Oscillospiraceae bacterium]